MEHLYCNEKKEKTVIEYVRINWKFSKISLSSKRRPIV